MYIFVDYDGTLIKNDEREFMKEYFNLLSDFSKIDSKKLIALVMESINEILSNLDTSRNLFERFLDEISKKSNRSRKYWKDLFFEFYDEKFLNLKKIIRKNQFLVDLIKNTNNKVIFASNPLFPKVAVEKRIEFVDLNPGDFFYITSMENAHYAKPDPRFFEEIIQTLSISPKDCVMIGDSENDKACEKVGIKFIHVDEKEKIKKAFLNVDYSKVIGKIRKNEEQKLAVMCYAEYNDKVLFITRNKEPFANFLVSPGGKVENGEEIEKAMVREFFEETGLKLHNLRLRMVTTEIGPKNYNWILFIFRGDVFSDDVKESDEGKLLWIKKEDILNANLTDIDKYLIPDIFSDEDVKVVEIVYDEDKNWKILSKKDLLTLL
ncbi:HAD-IA family hydrolase [Thermosipho affectus]|nr:HAD-IA family hydrolase [Thermosipho affectus]